jgi:hypothetical protein
MDITAEKKQFNKRAFTSIAMLLTLLVLPISGGMIHQLLSDPMTQGRHFWMSVHNISALLFTIFSVTHIVINRKTLIRYAVKAKGIAMSKEAIAAFILIVAVVGLFALHAFHVK